MNEILFEQLLLARADIGLPHVLANSPGFDEAWVRYAQQIALDFGDRPNGVACPSALFALAFAGDRVAMIRVADLPANRLGFHFVVVSRQDYARFLGNPFEVMAKIPTDWEAKGLSTLRWPAVPLPPRSVDRVRDVLQKLKANALPEDVDPEEIEKMERTPENSESPALLGGVQVLVDGGKLAFRRNAPDPGLLEGLWMLLPQTDRAELWPATFAFGNRLGFDALATPNIDGPDFAGYTSEEQALDYPEGYYELHLQIAAETNDQNALDRMLYRRTSKETWRLGLAILVIAAVFVLMGRFANNFLPGPKPRPAPPVDYSHRAAAAAGMIAVGDPWTTLGIYQVGRSRWQGK